MVRSVQKPDNARRAVLRPPLKAGANKPKYRKHNVLAAQLREGVAAQPLRPRYPQVRLQHNAVKKPPPYALARVPYKPPRYVRLVKHPKHGALRRAQLLKRLPKNKKVNEPPANARLLVRKLQMRVVRQLKPKQVAVLTRVAKVRAQQVGV